ncbi:AraC family transcriptional regulator [Kitasatospora sp. NPDC089797]|uniref:AraC family transcriptional regulator n=1 Tax=Kitasatospora sp. NPDC089797 TaxID=3155298 RepID=UPI003411FFB2
MVAAGAGSVFRGEGVPAKDRFDCWRELLARTRASEMTSAHADDFRAEMRRLELGPVTLLRSSFPPTRFRRTERMVRRTDPEVYHLTMPLDGGLALTRGPGDRTRTFGRGDLYLVDSSTPYDVRALGVHARGRPERRTEAVGIDVPVALLPLPPERLREVLGRGFSVRSGSAALLSDFLLGLDRQAAALGPAEAARMGAVVVDLVAAWAARELDAETALPDEARHRALAQGVRSFVRRHLHDPDLTPAVIAAAHHVSVSHLHRVFTHQSQGRTLAAWIREQRLAQAHRTLADPAHRTTPVHTVATRCGFPRADDFSRAFRTAYGLSPRDHRRQALTTATETGPDGA